MTEMLELQTAGPQMDLLGSSTVPVSWSGVIMGALDLRLSGLLEVRSKDSDGTNRDTTGQDLQFGTCLLQTEVFL